MTVYRAADVFTIGPALDTRREREAQLEAAETKIRAAFALLSERQRQVLTLRYGLADGEERTIAEVARQLGIRETEARRVLAGAAYHLRTSDFVAGAFREMRAAKTEGRPRLRALV